MEQCQNAGVGERDIPEKTRRPAASSGTIPMCENPGSTPPGVEHGSPWWKASSDISCGHGRYRDEVVKRVDCRRRARHRIVSVIRGPLLACAALDGTATGSAVDTASSVGHPDPPAETMTPVSRKTAPPPPPNHAISANSDITHTTITRLPITLHAIQQILAHDRVLGVRGNIALIAPLPRHKPPHASTPGSALPRFGRRRAIVGSSGGHAMSVGQPVIYLVSGNLAGRRAHLRLPWNNVERCVDVHSDRLFTVNPNSQREGIELKRPHPPQYLAWRRRPPPQRIRTILTQTMALRIVAVACNNQRRRRKNTRRAAVAERLARPPLTKANRSVPGRVTGFSHVGIMPDDAVGRRVFLRISHFPHHSGAAPHTNLNNHHRRKRHSVIDGRAISVTHMAWSTSPAVDPCRPPAGSTVATDCFETPH
ncbi:hypothetical protein PR048_031806 [Dryococelus australis]|uniref:Uncharacterized protein n=1 Tax=Dryococelus australis TaxID=614101 RepID=A0ABQ9G6C0_9NEOP|nr:hypothetical protein PR048_031806 [Dryococelus australis]